MGIGTQMYGTTDILTKALDASWKRNEVINQNIANVDTPGYNRKEVAFESYLNDYLKQSGKTVTTRGLSSLEAQVYEDRTSTAYRLDGNNVDIEVEMANLAENQIKYDTLTAQINYNFARLNTVLR